MAKFLRGALVEYGGNLLGPIPNVVVFQFNPEQLARTITIPTPPAATGGTDQRRTVETGQTATPPTETQTPPPPGDKLWPLTGWRATNS